VLFDSLEFGCLNAIVFADAFFKLIDGPTMTCDAVIVVLSTLPITSTVAPLVTALAGELEPASGGVLLDGTPPRGVERTSIAWLGQHPYLFSGTVQDNIALGRTESDELEVLSAALAAGLGGVLARLPDGLNTPVGESGWGLSGGEAHRVALARTFLGHAPLVLLDEPTAHLDATSELAITEIIATLSRSATTIVASHSPALLAICDRVITLDRGQLNPAPSQAAVGAMA
jgi:ATP-binding cassette, subfamily C, bacterial CydD